jgi:uncharacterized Zn-binding protein involved in type VI secretion
MPALTYKGALSKGSDGGAATPLTRRNFLQKSYVGGVLIGVVGDRFEQHTVPIATVHADAQREIISGASKTFFEGRAAARVDDPIADGDQVAQGNAKTFVE